MPWVHLRGNLLGTVCKLVPCHSERSEESHFPVGFQAKPKILRRGAKAPLTQNDMHEDFAYTP
jgi:hypothetical protein